MLFNQLGDSHSTQSEVELQARVRADQQCLISTSKHWPTSRMPSFPLGILFSFLNSHHH